MLGREVDCFVGWPPKCLLTKFNAYIINSSFHMIQNIVGKVLQCGVTTLLKTKDIGQKAQHLISKVVANIFEIFIWSKEAPCHEG